MRYDARSDRPAPTRMDFAFVLDPLPLLKAYKDSSIAMMRALAARGHASSRSSSATSSGATAATRARACAPLELRADDHDWYRGGRRRRIAPLATFDAVLMRKDPPFDMEYVYSTYLLEAAEREGARVFNRPRAIRDHNEKLAIAALPRVHRADARHARRASASTHSSTSTATSIVKPLDGMGGASIFRVRADDPNRNVIVETVSAATARARSWRSASSPRSPTATSACC